MKRLHSLSIVCLTIHLAACAGDETVRAYGAEDRVWEVQEIDGVPFDARATLVFPEPGRIEGEAPCNRYTAEMTVPYPWFEVGSVVATKLDCDARTAEDAFLTALAEMTLSEVLGNVLLLSTEDGRQMVFKSAD